MKREKFNGYEDANRIIREAGHEDPESLDPMERLKIVMTHIMKQPKPTKESR